MIFLVFLPIRGFNFSRSKLTFSPRGCPAVQMFLFLDVHIGIVVFILWYCWCVCFCRLVLWLIVKKDYLAGWCVGEIFLVHARTLMIFFLLEMKGFFLYRKYITR